MHTESYIHTYRPNVIHTGGRAYSDWRAHGHTYIHTYMDIHIHTYIHTYRQTDIHTYRQTYRHTETYIHAYIHTYIHTYRQQTQTHTGRGQTGRLTD